jgi:3-isopropylmalate dehydrogenase
VASHSFDYDTATVSRILKVALNLAEGRRGRLCLVVKPGGVPAISALWTDMLAELAAGRAVEVSTLEVDTAAYQVVAAGPSFDVIVAPNLFGDIIADVAAVHLPTRGMSYSGNYGPAGRAVYQTGHGAAYDLAGTGTANPIGQVLSLAMMLRESFGLAAVADAVEKAIDVTVGDGWRTADIQNGAATPVGTWEMGEKIAENTARLLYTSRVA